MNLFGLRVNHVHVCALILTVFTGIAPVFAANFVVTNENPSGPGSLRQAVLDANANGNPGEVDTITFDASVMTIDQSDLLKPGGGRGPIQITESLSITGTGPKNLTISGNYSWITRGGVLNGGFPDNPASTILVPSDVLFEVGRLNEDSSAIQFEISNLTVFRTAGLLQAQDNAQVTVHDVVISQNAFPLQSDIGGFVIGAKGPAGSLEIRNTEISGTKWDFGGMICAFASKPEPKTTYICTKNCPGYGGQVA